MGEMLAPDLVKSLMKTRIAVEIRRGKQCVRNISNGKVGCICISTLL
jgi:hypothetical protein